MKKRFVAVLVATILLGGISTFAAAQAQTQPQTPAPKPVPKQPQAKTQQEYDAYSKFSSETDFTKKTAMGEQFIKDFPDSELNVPYVLPQVVVGYQQLNNYEKTVECGEKILAADSSNAFALFMLSTVIPERIKDDDLDRQQKLDHTTDYAKKLLEVANSMQKPAPMTEDQWKMQKAQLQGGAYSALGFVALHKKSYDEAISEYKKSLEVYPKDPIAYYRLGLSYSFAKKNDEALKALATSVAMNGPSQAKSYLEQLYKAKNNGSLDGLDKMISEAASGLK
ncbi:MAG: tetratricopeptide repeat protein [Acidobacteriia bacterium]|nr:tetratricopeptide repeat protein [Terriglobia bacterium]